MLSLRRRVEKLCDGPSGASGAKGNMDVRGRQEMTGEAAAAAVMMPPRREDDLLFDQRGDEQLKGPVQGTTYRQTLPP